MKKYLMTGIAALALCAGFTSCSHDLDSYSPDEIKELEAQKIVNNYQKAFVATFGKVAANQTWGFGAASTRTRADGKFATTSGAYTNANMWADDFIVPTQLTPGQKLRVQKYFQTHKNPGAAERKTITDFFVQQVYDGFDDPITNYDGYKGTNPDDPEEKPYSTEQYLAADGRTNIQSGDHMDHLIVGGNHVNNFNNSTYGTKGAPNTNVQNSENEIYYAWGTKDVLDASSTAHSDQIQLMLNTTAYPWSYANSDASYVRDNRWTLVSAAEIDAWGREAGIGEDVTDKWNRSFIGFDFDQLPDKNCYTGTTAYYGDANERFENKLVYTLDGTVTEVTDGDTKIIVDGKEIPYLITDQNQYCGRYVGVGGMDNLNDYNTEGAYVPGGDNDNTLYLNTLPNEQSDHRALNMNFIAKMVRDGYLPVSGKNLKKWVQIGGCNDGYYTDWIVTFCEAKPKTIIITDPTEYSIRVMAEDLSASESSDFDFNDVVFDVTYNTDDANAIVTLRAAGGTLPLIVAVNNPSDDQDYTENEVHYLFGEPTNIMINTGRGGADGANNKTASRTISVPFSNINSEDDFLTAVKNIKVWVKKSVSKGDGTTTQKWFELTANEGEACCKFACGPDYEWCPERTNIDRVYTFSAWVQGFSTTLLPVDNE